MKAITAIIAALVLAGCSGMGTSSHRGMSGMSGMEGTDRSDIYYPSMNQGFDPNNPYHGG